MNDDPTASPQPAGPALLAARGLCAALGFTAMYALDLTRTPGYAGVLDRMRKVRRG